ncbi:ArsC family transcriptional regulator [bacterium]|nr:MAG: ArsC family transcriptional regulator [bacterium]
MVIQIMGTKKCSETQKAIRFFKERRITPHFRDLKEKELSPGEFDNIANRIGVENIIDRGSNAYKDKGLEYMLFDIKEEILENNDLVKTPIVRYERNVTSGYAPEEWKNWLK